MSPCVPKSVPTLPRLAAQLESRFDTGRGGLVAFHLRWGIEMTTRWGRTHLLRATIREALGIGRSQRTRQPVAPEGADSEVGVPLGIRTPPGPYSWTPERLIAIGDRTDVPLFVQPVQVHALRLSLLVEQDLAPAGGMIRAPELAETYLNMCLELWWRPCRWAGRNGVAEHFRRLNGHPKTWRWFKDANGQRRRLYVYPIPPPVSGRERANRLRNQPCLG